MPVDVDSILKKITDAGTARLTGKKKTVKPAGENDDDRRRQAAQDAGKARARAKEAEKNLQVANELLAEKDEEIKRLTSEVQDRDKVINDLKPNADSWKKHETKERTTLEARLPAELKADAKGMSLQHLRLLVDSKGTAPEGGGAKGGDKTTGKEPKTMEEAIAAGGEAFNKFVDGVTAGKINPEPAAKK